MDFSCTGVGRWFSAGRLLGWCGTALVSIRVMLFVLVSAIRIVGVMTFVVVCRFVVWLGVCTSLISVSTAALRDDSLA